MTRRDMERHASASYKRHRVDVTVRPLDAGSYIAVVVHDSQAPVAEHCAEYITDGGGLDDAVHTGFEIGRALVDGQLH